MDDFNESSSRDEIPSDSLGDSEKNPDSGKEISHEISADLIRGHINTIILRTLIDGEKYGYEIINEIEERSHGQYTIKQPTLYSALKRLEAQGYVTSYWGGVSSGGRRRYFNLTESGREISTKNIGEWEYSRTIIDSLISENAFDFESPAPSAVDMRLLKQATSRVPVPHEEPAPQGIKENEYLPGNPVLLRYGEMDLDAEDVHASVAEDLPVTLFSFPEEEKEEEREQETDESGQSETPVLPPVEDFEEDRQEDLQDEPSEDMEDVADYTEEYGDYVDESEDMDYGEPLFIEPEPLPPEPSFASPDGESDRAEEISDSEITEEPDEEEEPLPLPLAEEQTEESEEQTEKTEKTEEADISAEPVPAEDNMPAEEATGQEDIPPMATETEEPFFPESAQELPEDIERITLDVRDYDYVRYQRPVPPEEDKPLEEEPAAPTEQPPETDTEEQPETDTEEQPIAAEEQTEEPAAEEEREEEQAQETGEITSEEPPQAAEQPIPPVSPSVSPAEKTEEQTEQEPEKVFTDSEYRRLSLRSKIDREYKKTLNRIYASAVTQADEDEINRFFDEKNNVIDATDDDGNPVPRTGEIRKVINENPDIRQEQDDIYKEAAYISTEQIPQLNRQTVPYYPPYNPYQDNYTPAAEEKPKEPAYEDYGQSEQSPQAKTEEPFRRTLGDIYNVEHIKKPTPPPAEEEPQEEPEAEKARPLDIGVDFTDIRNAAKNDGIAIHTASGARKVPPIPEVLFNKGFVLLKCALVTCLIAFLEGLIVVATRNALDVTGVYPAIMMIVPAVVLAVFFGMYASKYGAESRRVNSSRSVTTAIVIFIIALMAICAVTIQLEVKLDTLANILKYVVIPSIYAFNVVIFSLVYYFMSRKK